MNGAQIWLAAARCLSLRIPFAVCHLPGEKDLDFFCGNCEFGNNPLLNDNGSDNSFVIGRWLAPWADRISIGGPAPADQADGSPLAGDGPLQETLTSDPFRPDREISKEEYLDAVDNIIRECRKRGGKTVYSRVISGRNPLIDIPKAASELFTSFPDSFGFLYYTPMTGCWLGASPETLLDFDGNTRRVSTMAFAGTRPATEGEAPWDSKNLHENAFVADYIRDKFRSLGIEPEISEPYTVKYGAIQHLRRDITAILPDGIDFPDLLDRLNPTPALCGTPLEKAIADIRKYELHERGCYGGFVGILNNHTRVTDSQTNRSSCECGHEKFRCFVNLRSARISLGPEGRFEIIAGGGILAGSDPTSEWAETEAKSSRLRSILSGSRLR